ncbi:MAG: CoA-binding protein [Planctomycetota bacterium]
MLALAGPSSHHGLVDARRSEAVRRFLGAGRFAVVGASRNRDKYGNKVLRCYLQHGLPVVAVHPSETEVEGVSCVPSLRSVPEGTRAASVVAPPSAAGRIVEDAISGGIEHLWFQPGAEEEGAVEAARRAGISVIADGTCFLVVMGYREG